MRATRQFLNGGLKKQQKEIGNPTKVEQNFISSSFEFVEPTKTNNFNMIVIYE